MHTLILVCCGKIGNGKVCNKMLHAELLHNLYFIFIHYHRINIYDKYKSIILPAAVSVIRWSAAVSVTRWSAAVSVTR